MDYRFLTQKTLSLINTSFILLFFSTNISAFETNSDSKVSANLEVSGALKWGSVDSDSEGIVSSITDDSDSTLPTTGAVKDYVDAQIATNNNSLIASSVEVTGGLKVGWVDSSSSGIVTTISNSSDSTIPTAGAVKAYVDAQVAGSSGGYPSEMKFWGGRGMFPITYCKNKGAGWRLPSLYDALHLLSTDQTSNQYVWTADHGFEAGHYIIVRATDGHFVSVDGAQGLQPSGFTPYYVCVR